MALIQCPECGQTISDKAIKCPKCGYPLSILKDSGAAIEESKLQDVQQANSIDETISTQEESNPMSNNLQKDKSNKKVFILISFGMSISVILAAFFILNFIFSKSLKVEEININKWILLSSTDYSDSYEGFLSTNETKPFIAVVGYYEEKDNSPYFVYMNDGNGIIQTIEYGDVDPSIEHKVIGYINGQAVDESDIKNISYQDADYEDWEYSENTDCRVNIELELNKKTNGILFFEISNDMTSELVYNLSAVVVDGKVEYSQYIINLPYKSRGVEVTLTPLFFCETQKLTEENYTVEQEFSIKADKGEYFTDYFGTEVLLFDGYDDGIITYAKVLTEGGENANRDKPVYGTSYLHKNECTISTYDYANNDDNILTPMYDISVIGYLSWDTIE